MYKFYKWFLVSVIVVLLTACGGGGSPTDPVNSETPQTIAIDKIMAYADDDTQPVPTIQDYEDAGVVGITSENIDDVNAAVADLTSSDVYTTEKIQKIVDNLGINILPTANAGPDLSVQVNQTINITGIGTDIDGTILSYEWKKADGSVLDTIASFEYTPTAVGTDTLTLTVTDDDGGTASDSMNVTVTAAQVPDTTPPVITVLGDNPVTVIQNTTYTDAGATAIDDRDGPVAVVTTGSVDITKVGPYTITYTATDSANNTATATRTVNVVLPPDTTPPVITVLGDNPVTVIQNTTYTDAGATAIDDRDGPVAVVTTGSVDITKVGPYTITYTATDSANNTATATRTVNVTTLSELTWNFLPSVVPGTQFDAQVGPNNLIHLISSRYYQLNLAGDILINENQGDEQQGLLSFPPAIAVGDDGSVHIVTRDAGDVKAGVDIRYRSRSATGNWDVNYIFGTRVPRNYVVGISWTDTEIIMGSTDDSAGSLYGDIHLWKAGESSESYLGVWINRWRPDVDIRMRGHNNKVYLGSGIHNSNSATVFYSQADTGAGLASSTPEIHNAGTGRRSFPDLAHDVQNNAHFVYGAESEVYYNKYNANGDKVFASDKRIFANLGTWHLSTGLSAVAVSESGEIVVAVALRTKGDDQAANSDILWTYSTDGGVSWSEVQDTGKNSNAGEGRRRPRLVAVGDSFVLFYGDSQESGISMGVLTFK